jgi:hypothetical protein
VRVTVLLRITSRFISLYRDREYANVNGIKAWKMMEASAVLEGVKPIR